MDDELELSSSTAARQDIPATPGQVTSPGSRMAAGARRDMTLLLRARRRREEIVMTPNRPGIFTAPRRFGTRPGGRT